MRINTHWYSMVLCITWVKIGSKVGSKGFIFEKTVNPRVHFWVKSGVKRGFIWGQTIHAKGVHLPPIYIGGGKCCDAPLSTQTKVINK